jgi:cytochrome c
MQKLSKSAAPETELLKPREEQFMKVRIVTLAYALAAVTTLVSASAFADGDADKGKKVYNKCKACHTLEAGKNRIGPSLHGIMGRAAGTVDGFKYSSAMAESGLTWDEATLAKYLEDPRGFIPGNKMAFPGLKKEDDRADVIAYIKANSM